jgi:hypothetical protein
MIKSTSPSQIKLAVGSNFILLDPNKLTTQPVTEVTNSDNTRTATLTASYQFEFLLPVSDYSSMTLSKSVSFLRGP